MFISSTMKDLGDARRAIAVRLRSLNVEPVNAEDMHPDGNSSWDVIRHEIETSHLFILLSGDSYGWVPNAGQGAGEGRSVTHMEALLANSIGLPILPFFKRLAYDSPRDTEDAKARDAFRREVGDWEAGRFRQEFEWIDELASKVGDAVLDLFQRSVLRELAERKPTNRSDTNGRIAEDFAGVVIPEGFIGCDPVLFAGAGVSVSAGLPTANVMAELFGSRLSLGVSGENILARHRFADVAYAVERRLGRAILEATIAQAFDVVQGVVPTAGHLSAVASFSHIVTTNYDDLFERACIAQGIPFNVRSPNGFVRGDGRQVTIFQLDGSVSSPSSLIVTEEDAAKARNDKNYWRKISQMIGNRPMIVVGHSLRDDNARRVLLERGSGAGLYVSIADNLMDDIVHDRFDLSECVATADNFLRSYESAHRNLTRLAD
ncbi:hypothetical protein ABID16_004512 [Rhizobium aquaticum]|uniref:DUF4062 domain-containing protein n=1 Tax=Rhizobium aquaticum TaxID=1549636 RepID=A0ABV2J609_9HYPH